MQIFNQKPAIIPMKIVLKGYNIKAVN